MNFILYTHLFFVVLFISKEKLNASHNKISGIPRSFFTFLPNINSVDFSHNNINGAIDLPDRLTYIDLSHSKIASIYQDFNDLSPEQQIDSKTLRIDGNPIRIFDWKVLPLVQSEFSLYISWRQITEFKIWSYLGKPIRVVTDSEEEGILHTPNSTIELHCQENSFKNIKRFELIDNQVENPTEIINCLAPTLKYLTLSGGFDEEFDSTSLTRFTNLRELSLREAQLTEFDFGIMENVTKLERLDISRNDLERVSNIPFLEYAKNLAYLNVAENELECTPELVKYLSPSITSLIFTGNYMGKVNAGTFDRLINLQYLELVNMSLVLDDLKPFESLKRLRQLDISQNNLENCNFPPLSSSLREIRNFKAVDCNVRNASKLITLFESSALLTKLDLSGNFLNELNVDALKNFRELQYLNLSNTNLSYVDFGILQNKKILKILDFSFNELEQVDFALVLSHVESIHLEGNELSEIGHFTKSHFPDLKFLDISKNQFECESLTTLVSQIQQEWPHLKMINNPWEQHVLKCHPSN